MRSYGNADSLPRHPEVAVNYLHHLRASGGVNTARFDLSRGGTEFSTYIVHDSQALISRLGYNSDLLTSTNMKGAFDESVANRLVTQEGRTALFTSQHNVNHQGLDNVSIDSNGVFVFTEVKFSASSGDVGASLLSNASGSGSQLSTKWLDQAINVTSGISPANRTKMRQAFDTGNFRTELIVVKPSIQGTSINSNFGSNSTFGRGGSDPISKVHIMEIDVKQ